MAGFGKAFDEAFRPANTQALASSLDIIKEKIKQNEEARKSSTLIDSLEARIIESAAKTGKAPEDLAALSKSFDALRKAKLSPTETLSVSKAIAPDMFKDQTAVNIFNVGQNGELTSAGQVPHGSKVFKQALTPEEVAARTGATQEATYEGQKGVADRAFSLRTEFQGLQQVKDYQVIKSQVESMDALLNKIKPGEKQSALALDQGLITLFNKVSDPTSVVRESEYSRTPENLSLANRFNGAIKKLEQGGAGLTQQDRESLVFGAKVIADSRGSLYDETLSNYENLAGEFGVKPSLVTSGYGKSKTFLGENAGTETSMVKIKNPTTGETKMVTREEAKKLGAI